MVKGDCNETPSSSQAKGVLLGVVALLLAQGLTAVQPENQTAILLEWRDTVSGKDILPSWTGEPCRRNTTINPGAWHGVNCSGSQVVEIRLPGQGLAGPISGGLFQIPSLTVLDLSSNRLSGTLPALSLTPVNLSVLALHNNSLTGTLPASWGTAPAFPSLTNLLLHNNSLSGTLPGAWVTHGSFPSLTSLDLSFNRLSGPLPTPAADVTHLAEQYWLLPQQEGFELCGLIPPTFGVNPQGVGRIGNKSQSDSRSSKSYPRQVSLCPCPGFGDPVKEEATLREFVRASPTLSQNPAFEGWLTTPMCGNASWTGVTCSHDGYVQSIVFSGINLQEPLPASFGTLTRLQTLIFSGVDVSGSLPKEWSGMTGLCTLAITSCFDVSGNLPPSWSALNVRNLTIVDSTLKGNLPATWAGMEYLQTLNLSHNVFKGTLPREWFEPAALPNLEVLDITFNPNLKGSLPAVTGGNLRSNGVIFMSPGSGFCGGNSDFNIRTRVGLPGNYSISTPCPQEAGRPPPSPHWAPTSDLTKAVAIVGPLVGFLAMVLGFVACFYSSGKDPETLLTQDGKNLAAGPVLGVAIGTMEPLHSTRFERGAHFDSAMCPNSSYPGSDAKALEHLKRISRWEVGDVTSADLDFRVDDTEKPKVLGRGASGEVLLAKWRHAPVAVKRLHEVEELASSAIKFRQEAELLRSLRHPNIVLFLGACMEPDQMLIVTEFCPGGSLAKALAIDVFAEERRLGWYGRGRLIAIGVARGLAYLHSLKVIHHDIKSANVLLDGTKTLAKIADLGVSRIQLATHATATVRGTLAYMAPECLGYGQTTSFAVDIFSFGVMLHEIVTGDPPHNRREALREPRVPGESPQEVVDLYKACMSYDPGQRPSAADIVQILEGIKGGEVRLAQAGGVGGIGRGAGRGSLDLVTARATEGAARGGFHKDDRQRSNPLF